MTYILQNQLERLKSILAPGKVVIIYGARRVGKMTLIKKFLEDEEKSLFGYEFKANQTKVNAPKLWLTTYPKASFECINQENYLTFIS